MCAGNFKPNTVVTRGAIETPEQYTPGIPLEGAWEGNLTMGQQWQYRPTNETYKSGTELIDTLIETRAKGGNLLLNIGPKPDGELPIEQEGRLREIGLWNMVNGESIYAVRPWVITNEENIWFTKAKDSNTVYAFVTGGVPWLWGEPRTLLLKSVKATAQTTVSVLGQNDKVLEYHPETVPATKWEQTADGLRITAVRAQRLYNDRRWPNPVVLKITNAEPGLTPPVVLDFGGALGRRKAASKRRGRVGEAGRRQVGRGDVSVPAPETGFGALRGGRPVEEPQGAVDDSPGQVFDGDFRVEGRTNLTSTARLCGTRR